MIDRYSRPEMAAIWTLENRYRNWFKVEQAVCQAWNEQGVIPDEETVIRAGNLGQPVARGNTPVSLAYRSIAAALMGEEPPVQAVRRGVLYRLMTLLKKTG